MADSTKKATAAKKTAAKVGSTNFAYVNKHLVDSIDIDAAILEHPRAKLIQHFGGFLDVDAYQNGKDSSK